MNKGQYIWFTLVLGIVSMYIGMIVAQQFGVVGFSILMPAHLLILVIVGYVFMRMTK